MTPCFGPAYFIVPGRDQPRAASSPVDDEPVDVDRLYHRSSSLFGRQVIEVPPGAPLRHGDEIWNEAIVVVIAGDLEIEGNDGDRQRFKNGAVLTLAHVPVRRAFNSGTTPLRLLVIWKTR